MADGRFEFVVEGPPVPLRAARKNAKRYREWKGQVHAAALARWPVGDRPTRSNRVAVRITNYFTLSPPDIDNIIKPILDALNGLVYEDDRQVSRVTSVKHDLSESVSDPAPLVAEGLALCSELIHVRIEWQGD